LIESEVLIPPLSKWLRKEWWNNAREILMEGEDDFLTRATFRNFLRDIKVSYLTRVGCYFAFLTLRFGKIGI